MRILYTLLLLTVLPSVALAHPHEEIVCACAAEASNGFTVLSIIGYVVGLLIAVIAIGAIWLYLELPLGLLQLPVVIFGGYLLVRGQEPLWGLPPGFWGFVAAVCWGSFSSWWITKLGRDGTIWDFVTLLGMCWFPVWALIAYQFDSVIVGTMAVAAFATIWSQMSFLDLAGTAFGMPDSPASTRTTLVGFIILVPYLVFSRWGWPVEVFTFGALYISGLVINANLLLSTWGGLYREKAGFFGQLQYYWRELLFLSYSLCAVVYGQVLESEVLVKMGGTFLFFWLLVKLGQLVSWIFHKTRSIPLAAAMTFCLGALIIYSSSNLEQHASWLQQYVIFF